MVVGNQLWVCSPQPLNVHSNTWNTFPLPPTSSKGKENWVVCLMSERIWLGNETLGSMPLFPQFYLKFEEIRNLLKVAGRCLWGLLSLGVALSFFPVVQTVYLYILVSIFAQFVCHICFGVFTPSLFCGFLKTGLIVLYILWFGS